MPCNIKYAYIGDHKYIPESGDMLENAYIGLNQYKKLFRDMPKTVIDVGAHVGGLTLKAISKGIPYILAIEADDKNYHKLMNRVEKQIKDTKYKGTVQCIHKAYCAINTGFVDLIAPGHSKDYSGQRSICYHQKASSIKNNYLIKLVDAINTDGILSLLDKNNIEIIDLFKCDIEGAEFTAMPINDKTREFLSRIKYIDIEIHSLTNKDYFDAENFFEKLPGYDRKKNEVTQFLEFIESCGFYISDINKDLKWWLKLTTYNKLLCEEKSNAVCV